MSSVLIGTGLRMNWNTITTEYHSSSISQSYSDSGNRLDIRFGRISYYGGDDKELLCNGQFIAKGHWIIGVVTGDGYNGILAVEYGTSGFVRTMKLLNILNNSWTSLSLTDDYTFGYGFLVSWQTS